MPHSRRQIVKGGLATGATFSPVAEGKYLPHHPFDPRSAIRKYWSQNGQQTDAED